MSPLRHYHVAENGDVGEDGQIAGRVFTDPANGFYDALMAFMEYAPHLNADVVAKQVRLTHAKGKVGAWFNDRETGDVPIAVFKRCHDAACLYKRL